MGRRHRGNPGRWPCFLVAAIACCVASATPNMARAQGIVVSETDVWAATLDRPVVLAGEFEVPLDPLWVADTVWPFPAQGLEVLRSFERHGPLVWDPSSGAWYVWANGAIVRLDGGRAVVVVDGVQGRDFDVRAARGVAVSREPDHTIVLWRLDAGAESRRVLLRGSVYFHPRFSPDASAVLVQEARGEGGRLVLISMDGQARDLGPGSDGVFTPDGRGVICAVVSGDGHRVVDADLVYLDLVSGRRTRLTWTADAAEVEPAVSPDGRFIAFVEARTGSLCVARMPALPAAGGVP